MQTLSSAVSRMPSRRRIRLFTMLKCVTSRLRRTRRAASRELDIETWSVQLLTADDSVCIPVRCITAFGMVLGVLAAMTHGAASVLSGDGFEPLAVLETVANERCTALHGVPTMFIRGIGASPVGRFDLSSLRTGIMAGSPCPIAVMRRVIARCTCRR